MCTVSSFFNVALMLTPKKGARNTYNKITGQSLQFDAVIVPGTPFYNGNWSPIMKARILWSWLLYKNGITKSIVYSGGAVYSPYKEAIIMGLYARKLGIPANHIYYDTNARHSTENIYYSYLIAKKHGFKSLALATDPFQSFLLKGFTRKRFETPVYHIPFVADLLKPYSNINSEIDPETAIDVNFKSIKQESFWQRFKGTLGKNIDWEDYPSGRLGPL